MKCDHCAKPIGWHGEKTAATSYAMTDGLVHLCSAKCEMKWIQARQPKQEAKPK